MGCCSSVVKVVDVLSPGSNWIQNFVLDKRAFSCCLEKPSLGYWLVNDPWCYLTSMLLMCVADKIFSVKAAESTLGQSMLNLKYINEGVQSSSNQWISHRQKLLYACLLIGCPWLKERSHDIIKLFHMEKWREKIEKLIKWLETGFKVATLVNFLVFLRQGSYLSLLERIVGIRSVFPEKQGIRQEFLFFVLPLINFQRLKNLVVQRFLSSSASSRHSSDLKRNYTNCAICGEWPIRMQEFGCPHVFCYFCIQSNYKADPSYACPLCSCKVGDISNIHDVSLIAKDDDDDDDDT
ncbi:peroxisome biogenesis factor 2-like [Mercenaria mercenaria]|uniref:peroxisome biogenesis factor 2-like n=1 Tax=Mercenaria mercenaria TaxID=6596 RepID=UPI00234F3941|nr:peroxisome biogenesis factor 2-like [Mercenaria mercenaria]